MTDLSLAAQQAIYDALNVPAVTAGQDGMAVFQHVPDKRQPPMHIIGDLTASPAGGKGIRCDLFEAEILTLVRQPSRKPLYAAMAKVRVALDGKAISAAGATFSRPVFESSDDEMLDDGKTYLGTQRFSLFAQPSN